MPVGQALPSPSHLGLPPSPFAPNPPHYRANVSLGVKEDRLLITGLHTVCDIYCVSCSALLGWKYETAYEQSQKYKEGKYIVEKAMVMREGGW